MRVTAIVPAAGESRRMGALKPLLPFGSSTVIQTVVHSLRACPVDPVLVVLGHRAAEIARALKAEQVRIVRNPRYRQGMLTSIQAGAAAAPEDAEWLLVALGDQPTLRTETVARLLEAAPTALASGKRLVVPSFNRRRGHPLLIHASLRGEIAGLDPNEGLRGLFRRHPDAVEHVEIADDSVLADLDTPEDYQRVMDRAPAAQIYSVRIADMLPESRPRERLEAAGGAALTTAELLAILFRTGTRSLNAVQVGEALLREVGGLGGLARASLDQLARASGVGRVKAIEVQAALELGKRLIATEEGSFPQVHTPADVARLMMPELRHETREHFCTLLLDARNRVRHTRRISVGTLTQSLVHPREVFADALQFSAAALILVHNHPSGDPHPSPDDIATTKRLVQAGNILGIEVLDHVIVGDGVWASLKQLGLMC